MGDIIKIPKEKKHRSSVSLLGLHETKILNTTVSKPDMNEHFAIAEARCGQFQQKIDYVKSLKRRKKLKRRSCTKFVDAPVESDLVPLISIKTKPKQMPLLSAVRSKKLPTAEQDYKDPKMMEQHRIVAELCDYTQNYQNDISVVNNRPDSRYLKNTTTNEGEANPTRRTKILNANRTYDVHEREQQLRTYGNARGRSLESNNRGIMQDSENVMPRTMLPAVHGANNPMGESVSREQTQSPKISKDITKKPDVLKDSPSLQGGDHVKGSNFIPLQVNSSSVEKNSRKCFREPRFQLQRYEMPTVSSQLKRAGVRYYQPYRSASSNRIPFVATKSCAPSHNIGVNLQQVLNGLKIQQPIGGIPLSIAHHMGLRHLPYITKSEASTNIEPTLDVRDINVIKLGGRLVHLPSYKFMSYRRLLDLFKEGDGMVSRFLKAMNRPHCFYTTMYSLTATRGDSDDSTSKGKGHSETKQLLAEYATFYNEYERLERRISDGDTSPLCQQRRDELVEYLATREDYIRQMIKECNPRTSHNLKRSASTTFVNKVKGSQISVL